jgi:hypothetical protein
VRLAKVNGVMNWRAASVITTWTRMPRSIKALASSADL